MVDFSKVKLGKKPAKIDPRTLRLAKYLLPSLPAAPSSVDWTGGVKEFGQMLNNVLGDCTVAAVGHAEQIWSIAADSKELEFTPSDHLILEKYMQWCGYVPGDPSTDQGGVEIDVLNDWRKHGFHPALHPHRHPLLAYADPDPANTEHIRQAINLFGGVYIGLELPICAQTQDVWDTVSGPTGEPGSWGGHAVFVCGYDESTFTFISWGQVMKMTIRFWEDYVDEAHALVSAEFLNAGTGETPVGFDLVTMLADLQQVAGD
jgi:hypothetical protein